MWMLSPEEHGHGVGKQPGVVHTAQQSLAVVPVCSDSRGARLTAAQSTMVILMYM